MEERHHNYRVSTAELWHHREFHLLREAVQNFTYSYDGSDLKVGGHKLWPQYPVVYTIERWHHHLGELHLLRGQLWHRSR